MNRREIEGAIIDSARRVPILEPDWYDSREYNQLLIYLDQLADHYRESRENQLSAAAVLEFLAFMRLLRKIIILREVSRDVDRERAQDELAYLEFILEKIVSASTDL